MTPDALDLLRCPIDPKRESTLTRDRDRLCCQQCGTTFPVKNGLPVLLADEATFPEGVATRRELPCLRR